ncbi:YicC/YloC family endoribonuclease [Alkalitalea saponilacus]|uniref:TIGR00255 family protein n=1 Tax=Alkalitalea saponilacus TaxID=889453 RepID=A0A1T5HSK7_9BACT|nr:YicC/YloC family endoribonuclease [Alkalitalea saponilacus]ASB47747.1 YicC family protein [Alkalitalea saponilacus]SKC23678.1 TIGR00255 family protein [Alkalitalea saponilacus]
MIKSMTGFGKAVCDLPAKKVHIEIKSLNGKQLDLNLRIPVLYREKEHEIRNLIAGRLQRGKVDLTIVVESLMPDNLPQINKTVFQDYYNQLSAISGELNIGGSSDFIRTIMMLPDVLKTGQASLDEKEWSDIKDTIEAAIESIDGYRSQEGRALQEDITSRLDHIEDSMNQVLPFENQRLERIKSRIRENLTEVIDSSKIDENRFEQELIYYIEKLDITEEKVRLKNHLDYFKETMGEEQPVGKKLAFISQEIGREINTLGSKANDADLQRLVIKMKDELEKIKEQTLNVL